MSAGVKKLQELFGNTLDPDVLAAVLEMNGGDTRAAVKFLQAQGSEVAHDPTTLAQNEGVPKDYPSKSWKGTQVKKIVFTSEQQEIQDLLKLFLGENMTLENHWTTLKKQPHLYLGMLMLLIENNVEIIKAARSRILAVVWAGNLRNVAEWLLTKNEMFGLPVILGALQLLDAGRKIRAVEKKMARLEKQVKKKGNRFNVMRTQIAELKKEINIGSVSGALAKIVIRWCQTIPKDSLEYFALNMPPEPWRELADLVHLNPKSHFKCPWFLSFIFGEKVPADSAIELCKDLSAETLGKIIQVYEIPYSYLRTKVKNIPQQHRLAIAKYIPLDTLVWWYEELACAEVDKLLDKRLDTEKPSFGYGKLCERLLYFQSLKTNSFFKKLMPVAEERLKSINLKLEAPLVILGDASYSMDVSIRVSTVIASVLTALCNAELRFFNDKDIVPPHIPTNVAEVLDMATNMKADGQTAPAASLWPYYQQKKVVRMFVVVTDEVENGKYKNFYFPELFYKYYTEVYPARIVFVSFLDNPSLKGRMVTALEAMGIEPIQFKLDGKRPDLQKLDHILAVLSMESTYFPKQVREFAPLVAQSPMKALETLQAQKNPNAKKNEDGKQEVKKDEPQPQAKSVVANKKEETPDIDMSKLSVSDSSSSEKKVMKQSIRENSCVICLESEITNALLDCGHLSFCDKCAQSLIGKECPICRKTAIQTVRIYHHN